MKKHEKVEAFKKVHVLLICYSENRDQPVEEGFDFLGEVQDLCHKLSLDYESFKKEFNLNSFG